MSHFICFALGVMVGWIGFAVLAVDADARDPEDEEREVY